MPDKPSEFLCHVPLEIFEKAGERFIRGFVTTEHEDREKEVVLQDGLDFSEFLSTGYFNDNHSKKTADVLGYPLSVTPKVTPDGRRGHYVEGKLLKNFEPADQLWGLAQALKGDGGKRQLGFSLQGSILRREGPEGRVISKAKVRHVAITNSPVNPYTGMETLAKALMAGAAITQPDSPSAGDATALRPEALEGREPLKKKCKKKKKKQMNKAEAVEWLRHRGYGETVAERIAALALRRKE